MSSQPEDQISRGSAGTASNGVDEKPQSTKVAKRPIRAEDANFVTWDGADDRENPKNWAPGRKWLATLLVSFISLMTLLSSSMIAPALNNIAQTLNLSSGTETELALSAFVLAYAFAPMFIGPLSEIYGRIRVLQASNAWFLVWTIVCGFAYSEALMVTARFLSGIGGGAIFAIGSGFIGDCWKASERGKSFAIYNAVPLLGPAVGPLIGGYVTDRIGWRWIFWIVAIFDGCVLLLTLCFLRETHARTILYRRMQKIKDATGNAQLYTTWDTANDEKQLRSLRRVVATTSTRAFRMLGTQPLLQIIALYQAYAYGVMFLVISTFATVWTDTYHETVSQSGLNYLSLAVGSSLASLVGGPVNDRTWAYLSRKHQHEDGHGVPEYRVPLMIPGSILIPAGLFCYGWSVQEHLHWIIPNVGIAIFMIGITSSGQCMAAYVIDAYAERTASAMACVTLLRSVLGFVFPLFATQVYQTLGYGWGNSLLAFLAIAIGIPVPFILWTFGASLRRKSGCKEAC